MTDKRLNKTCHSAKTKFVPRGKLLDPPESYGPRAFWCNKVDSGWRSQPCSCLKQGEILSPPYSVCVTHSFNSNRRTESTPNSVSGNGASL